MLSDIARRRLSAIREFTQLGSGYRVAMRDLQIRGAGSLLGEYQSGNIGEIGYDLYCKLLGEAVAQAKREPAPVRTETVMDMDLDAYLPSGYIHSENQKLDMYKRISSVQNEEEYEDVVEELLDRFGEIPAPAMNLLRIVKIKARCAGLDVQLVSLKNGILQITLSPRAGINVDAVPDLLKNYGRKLKLKFSGKAPLFEMDLKNLSQENSLKETEDLISEMRKLLLGQDGESGE